MFTVVERAESNDLTTLEAVKSVLGITGAAEDDYLSRIIRQASSAVTSYLRVPQASDGSRTLAVEKLEQTFRFEPQRARGGVSSENQRQHLILARKPVTSVVSVIEGTRPLDVSEYELDGASGLLKRLRNDRLSNWSGCSKVVVTFSAGWKLPDAEDDQTMPSDIEDVVVDLVKLKRASRNRDPLVKSIEVVDVDITQYWVGSTGKDGALPQELTSRLDGYRYSARI